MEPFYVVVFMFWVVRILKVSICISRSGQNCNTVLLWSSRSFFENDQLVQVHFFTHFLCILIVSFKKSQLFPNKANKTNSRQTFFRTALVPVLRFTLLQGDKRWWQSKYDAVLTTCNRKPYLLHNHDIIVFTELLQALWHYRGNIFIKWFTRCRKRKL